MTAPRISAKSNENMDVITFQALANIYGNFRKYKISRKFTTLVSIPKYSSNFIHGFQSAEKFGKLSAAECTKGFHWHAVTISQLITCLLAFIYSKITHWMWECEVRNIVVGNRNEVIIDWVSQQSVYQRRSNLVVWRRCNIRPSQTVLYRVDLVTATVVYEGRVNLIFAVSVPVTWRRRCRSTRVSAVILLTVVVKTGEAPLCKALHLMYTRLATPASHTHAQTFFQVVIDPRFRCLTGRVW